MVQYPSEALNATFAALSDPIRRATVERLAAGETSVGELAGPHDITLPAMLKHVRALERAGLVETRKVGRTRYCRLLAEPLGGAMSWLQHYHRFWHRQLTALDRYLTSTPGATWPPPPPTSPSNSAVPTPRRRSVSSRRGRKPRR